MGRVGFEPATLGLKSCEAAPGACSELKQPATRTLAAERNCRELQVAETSRYSLVLHRLSSETTVSNPRVSADRLAGYSSPQGWLYL
jgi:hypothetical protein